MQLCSSAPSIAQCSRCLKWWKPGNTACCVMHTGDGCCHYGDTEVPAPES